MPTFEYAPDVIPTTPYPLFAGFGYFADLHGQQIFRGPIRGYAGTVQAPTFTFGVDNRSGWYQPWPNSLGAAIAGFLRFVIDEEGVTYRNTLGHSGTVAADLLTANRTYQLPNESGILLIDLVSETADYMTINVSNFAQLLLAANPARKGLEIVNNGDVDLYIGHSSDLVAGNVVDDHGGKLVRAKGGSWEPMNLRYTGAVYGRTLNSSTTVSVTEYL